jgi:DNA replication protein DnaC
MTGTGKSYVGAALAEAACRRGHLALRVRVPRLLQDLAIARADGSYGAALSRLAKLDVLVLDDLLIAPMKDTERRDLLEVLEDRYDQRSTVVTSQVPTKSWHEMLADPTVADAICNRLVHNAHVLSLKGPGWERGTRTTRADHPRVSSLRWDRSPNEGSRRCAPMAPGCPGTDGRVPAE